MSTTTEAPPSYTLTPPRPATSSSSSSTSLPAYTPLPASTTFTPTTTLNILTPGKALFSLPAPPAPIPIPIHDAASPAPETPKYLSLRATRRSGTATLVPGATPSAPPLATTTYRFGPGRPPSLTLHTAATASDGADDDEEAEDVFFTTEMTAPTLSRTTTLSTPLGRFRWRYPSRAEKAGLDTGHGADCSLLLLERLPPVGDARAGSRGTEKEKEKQTDTGGDPDGCRLVGYLLRRKCAAAGEGGALRLDLASADEGVEAVTDGGAGYVADEKKKIPDEGAVAPRDVLERVAVASCISMLKREIDRLRLRQGLVLAGAAGGGP
ncbi:hypothetical protein ACHAQA_004428 [Verticillium albo-atrum]